MSTAGKKLPAHWDNGVMVNTRASKSFDGSSILPCPTTKLPEGYKNALP